MKLFAIFAVLALTCFVYNTEALTFYRLEQFQEGKEAFIQTPNTFPGLFPWYTPYYAGNSAFGPPPEIAFMTTSGSVGGETDLVIGYEITADPGVTATLNSRRTGGGVGGIFFTLGFVGGGFWQWDGPDQNAPTPGRANPSPGIGSSTTYVYLPQMATDGQSIDITLGGRVTEFNWQALTDLNCEYEWDFFDRNNASTKYTIPINTINFSLYRINFASTQFTRRDPGWRGFQSIAAIQLTVYTFFSDTNAIDTEFKELNFVGYLVDVNVKLDCDCDITNATPGTNVQGIQMQLRDSTGTSTIRTLTTDVNGSVQFFGMADGTYQVCIVTPLPGGATLCSGNAQCRTITLTNFVDPPLIQYVIVQPPTLSPPSAITIECGDCTLATVGCTGVATLVDCNSGSTPVTTFTDTTTIVGCTVTRTRTFTASGLTAVQIITEADRTSPRLDTPASPVIVQCGNQVPSFATFLSTFGGATWSDCTSFTVANGNPVAPVGCSSRTVTFTATDPCGNPGTSTAASYTIQDGIPPTISPQASGSSAQCNTNGSDFAALNTWLADNGGARATDNCGSPSFSNNYNLLPPLQRGCNNAVTVTFTAADSCLRTSVTTATFTITDSTGPSITTPAQSPAPDTCDANTNTRFNTWLNNHGNAIAADTCTATNLLTWSDDFPGTTLPVGCDVSVTVTFTVFDDCLRTSQTTATYRATDRTAPRVTRIPDNLDVSCDAANANVQISTWLNNHGNAVAVDDCSGASVTWTNNFADISTNCGSNVVTFTVCDVCDPANCASTTALFSISDSQPPSYITPPQPASAPCNTNTQSAFNAWIASGANAVLSDNCDTAGITFTNDNGPGFPFGCGAVRTVNFFARDACGNAAPTRSATFTVTDSVAPFINTPATSPSVECDSTINSQYNTWRNAHGNAIANDECATVVTWRDNGPSSISAPITGCVSAFTLTFLASDGCGNESPTTGTFTVTDTTRPVINPQAQSQTSECTGSGTGSTIDQWLSNNGGARATDACSSVTWRNNFNGFSGGCDDSATVTFTASDVCGLTSTTVATFSVSDTAAPVINPPAQPLTSQCGPNTNQDFTNWLNNHAGAVAVDACQTQASLVWTNDVGQVTFSTCGTRTVTFTVTDACDRSASTTAVFTVADQTPPTFNPPARDQVVECQKTGNQADYNAWLGTRGGSLATDSCAVQITYSNNAPSVGPSRCASVTVTFSATDNCNNVGRTTATFSVADSSPPVFTQFPLTRLADCSNPTQNQASLNSWLSNFAGANAVDACTPSSELVYAAALVDTTGDSCVNRQIYRFTVTDSCGRSSSDTAAFIVADIDDPFFIIEPDNATFVCDGNGNVNEISDWISSNGGGSAADECQSSVVWSNNYRGVGPFTCTSNLVTFVVSDACGNSIAKTVLLTITDDDPPVFSNVPEDTTVRCDVDTHPQFLGYPDASDVCTGNPIISFEDIESDDPPIGACPGNHYILRVFSTFDECGNINTVNQLITVNLTRSAGPCDPSGCVCDDCCPEASPSNCLASFCEATPCRATPCTASTCLCPVVAKEANALQSADDLPQCEPIYIYVHDDDDSEKAATDALREPKMLVTNRLVDFNKSDASLMSFSVLLFFVLFFLF